MTGVAQTQRPHHRAIELQAKRRRRTTRSIVAGFVAAPAKLEWSERAGAASMFPKSVDRRRGICKSGLALHPALAFLGREDGLRSTADQEDRDIRAGLSSGRVS